MGFEERLAYEASRLDTAESELRQLRAELARARQAAIDGTARDAEVCLAASRSPPRLRAHTHTHSRSARAAR